MNRRRLKDLCLDLRTLDDLKAQDRLRREIRTCGATVTRTAGQQFFKGVFHCFPTGDSLIYLFFSALR